MALNSPGVGNLKVNLLLKFIILVQRHRMLRRIIYGGLFAVVVAGLGLIILLQRLDRITPVEVLQAVPDDAILFIEDVDYEFLAGTFLQGSRLWIDFINTTARTRTDSVIKQILATIDSNAPLREILLKEGLSLSLHLQGKEQLVPLFYISYAGYHNDNDFEQLVLGLLDGEAMVNERKYETETLFDVSAIKDHSPGKFTFACVSGICMISPTSLLVEGSVRNIHTEYDPEAERGLKLIRGTAGKYVHANIYIDYSRIHMLFRPIVKEPRWEKLEGMGKLATWGELDLDIKEDAIILNGMTYVDQEEPLFLRAFAGQAPVRMELQEMMPSGTSWFLHLGISNRELFLDEFMKLLAGRGLWKDVETEVERLDSQYGIDPLGDLFTVMDDELAWFAYDGMKPGQQVLLVETRSHSETRDIIMRWIGQYLQKHKFDMQAYRTEYRLDDQTRFQIYRLPEHYFKGQLPSQLFHNYFTLYENCLIFGPSVQVISRVIYQNILHKTFVSDPVHNEISDYFSNRSNLSLFMRPFAFLDGKREILDNDAAKKMDGMELFLRRIPGMVVQYSSEEQLFYQSVSCKYTSQIREKALTVWESLLDSLAVMKPFLVVNHNTQEKEIFIQDASNKIYLINSTGRILWEQEIAGPILGSIFQVDYYRNGKLQYLFNTTGKLHLIDRNGNYVERYPVSLRAAATSPIALFDYDKSRDYRIFVAGEDRKIYVYDLEGNVVTGWKFGKTESTVTSAPQHFRIGDRDYIAISDDTRSYFLDRRGRERVKPRERVVFSSRNSFTLDMNIREERPRWISTDTAGNVVCIYLDGTVSTLLRQEMGRNHFFRMQDMDKDGLPDYIFAAGDELSVVGQDGKRLFSFRVRDRISDMPDIYKFSASDIKIGLTDRARNRIYLVNADGSLYEGFPLEGFTRFSIGYFAGSDSRFNLIVGSENGFLYNYSIR